MLEAPYSSTLSIAKGQFPWLPVELLMIDQFRSDRAIGNIHSPLLIIHGDRDSVIPFDEGQRLYELASQPKTFLHVPGGKHSNLFSFDVSEAILEFLNDSIATGPAKTNGPAHQ